MVIKSQRVLSDTMQKSSHNLGLLCTFSQDLYYHSLWQKCPGPGSYKKVGNCKFICFGVIYITLVLISERRKNGIHNVRVAGVDGSEGIPGR